MYPRIFALLWPLTLAIVRCLPGCSSLILAKPFAWPGLDSKQGKLIGSSNRSVILAITHAELIGSRRAGFDLGAAQVLAMLPSQPGLVGYSVRSRLVGHEVWTATLWVDASAMNAFVLSKEHMAAVRQGTVALKSVQYHRVEIPVSELPLGWNRVLAELADAAPPRQLATP